MPGARASRIFGEIVESLQYRFLCHLFRVRKVMEHAHRSKVNSALPEAESIYETSSRNSRRSLSE